MRKIVALVDFSAVSDIAVAYAGAIRKKTNSELVLFHIAAKEDEGRKEQIEADLWESGNELKNEEIPFTIYVGFGDFYEIVHDELEKIHADIVVVGTHGMRGRKRNLYSENILKLVSSLDIPTLVVQGNVQAELGYYKNILIPVLGKVEGVDHADLIAEYNRAFGAKVHVLNFVNSDSESEDNNGKEEILKQFAEMGAEIEFSKQFTAASTVKYGLIIEEMANRMECDLIVWTKALGNEARQMDAENKTNLILNKYGIPALLML